MNEVAELFRGAETPQEAMQFLDIIGEIMDENERTFFLVSPVFSADELRLINKHPLFPKAPMIRGQIYECLAESVRPDRQMILDILNMPKLQEDHELLLLLAARSVHRDSYVAIMERNDPFIADQIRKKIAEIPPEKRITCENFTQDGRPNPQLLAALVARC